MAEEPGTLIGHYRLVDTIGSGGFSTVYRAVDERLEADVALKVLAENHALDPEVRERFVAEAQLLRRIECPAVIAVHDVGETDRAQPYIVMSLADRGDLATRANRLWGHASADISNQEALLVARTLATGLGRAHREGLVHRDVKPANLLLATDPGAPGSAPLSATPTLIRRDERILLSDLGFGKDLLASSGLTVGGGTYGFAAPEQRTAHGTVDPRADIHAASALLYWLFTRRTPPDDGADLHLSTQLPPPLVPVLQRGLATDPERRYATIDDWFEVTSEALEPRSAGAARSSGATGGGRGAAVASADGAGSVGRAARSDRRRSARRRWPAALVALALGLGAGAVGARALGWTTGDATTVDVEAGGTKRVSTEGNGLTLAVSGPVMVTVGEQIELAATADDATSISWFAPAGGTSDGRTLTLDAARPGVASITAVAADDLGRTVSLEFQVTVEATD